MELGILSSVFILLTWFINETMEDPNRIYALVVLLLIWLCLAPVFIGPELTSLCNWLKKK